MFFGGGGGRRETMAAGLGQNRRKAAASTFQSGRAVNQKMGKILAKTENMI
jgi:hypothetical protein